MNSLSNANKNTNKQLRETTPYEPVPNTGNQGDEKETEKTTTSSSKADTDLFIGKEKLLEQFKCQLKQFEEWDQRRDWLAFHHHHYDWWMFPSESVH